MGTDLAFSQPQPAVIKSIGVRFDIITFLMNYGFHLKIDPLFWLKTEKAFSLARLKNLRIFDYDKRIASIQV